MNKRFFDRDIWKKQWFRKLSPAEKSAWFYLTSTCDAVGVYENDPELAEIFIGETVDWEGLKKKVNENIKTIGENKWWLADFCNFQYGELKETSNSLPIKSYIETLKRHGLWEAYQKGLVLKKKKRIKIKIKIKIKK
jgi:hypothetical protein